ncbi:Murein DD-endopeptidase MepM and murein hydrolase activator NlpD, contain LysM domain [Salinihabitans flavidus]|uniref:Murein DD-endopeptidase MepM and murein hydrolase activator NlpD, contain LysM domain n=1 Tax=Salinihabitans flavidus TaxID=569882 RepID=A0A1H8QB37_9RHOB|nr:M23 family metallopeptidase [Salinihabitans flavidus]SEO51439.1 Murein DD-endopeptidase MepM and murein hydrolase activator NlpD, contain LysM domain [Salinihabitans flavidus]
MRTRIAIRLHALLERYFPERRLFLRSDSDTRFIRLRPETQLFAATGSALIVGWAIVATAILLMDSIGSGNFREQARRDRQTYEVRLNEMSRERDQRTQEAQAAQSRFAAALEQISVMQSELLASETRRKELETGIEVIQSTLRRTMNERDTARAEVAATHEALEDGTARLAADEGVSEETLKLLTGALTEIASERDRIFADAQMALAEAEDMRLELRLMEEKNDQIFRQLEDAMSVSVEPLEKMFEKAGLSTDSMLAEVRKGYSGQGGPLTPIAFSTRGEEPSEEAMRANRLLNQMDRLNMYRIAAETAPFALPIKNAFRYTSGYGMRWGRMHKGTDFAARHGTPIYSTAEGVVIHAGWLSGYGRLVKIRHDHGIETRYAHLAKIRVKEGQRVSRGELIGDMGNSGRSTGTHLHYEVRVNGKAVNPMIFIKAARDVF